MVIVPLSDLVELHYIHLFLVVSRDLNIWALKAYFHFIFCAFSFWSIIIFKDFLSISRYMEVKVGPLLDPLLVFWPKQKLSFEVQKYNNKIFLYFLLTMPISKTLQNPNIIPSIRFKKRRTYVFSHFSGRF